jgi:hypothetical protein
MTVRLRPHHLLCLIAYRGRGYTPGFVANMTRIAERLRSGGEPIRIVAGPDDVCRPLLATADRHCRQAGARRRDARAAADIARVLATPVRPGVTLPSAVIARLGAGFASGSIRGACRGCPWQTVCTLVAARDPAAAGRGGAARPRR